MPFEGRREKPRDWPCPRTSLLPFSTPFGLPSQTLAETLLCARRRVFCPSWHEAVADSSSVGPRPQHFENEEDVKNKQDVFVVLLLQVRHQTFFNSPRIIRDNEIILGVAEVSEAADNAALSTPEIAFIDAFGERQLPRRRLACPPFSFWGSHEGTTRTAARFEGGE